VPAGQGVLWSVGPDLTDDGAAVATEVRAVRTAAPGDIVYLVPLPPAEKKP
jgi:hypothetical protein